MSLYANLVGGSVDSERQRAAQSIATTPGQFGGISIGGLCTGENPAQRLDTMLALSQQLPEGCPRHAPGIGSPLEVLDAIAAGMDLFDSIYPYNCAVEGLAITFGSLTGREDLSPFFFARL